MRPHIRAGCSAPSARAWGPGPTSAPKDASRLTSSAAGSDSECGAMVSTISPTSPYIASACRVGHSSSRASSSSNTAAPFRTPTVPCCRYSRGAAAGRGRGGHQANEEAEEVAHCSEGTGSPRGTAVRCQELTGGKRSSTRASFPVAGVVPGTPHSSRDPSSSNRKSRTFRPPLCRQRLAAGQRHRRVSPDRLIELEHQLAQRIAPSRRERRPVSHLQIEAGSADVLPDVLQGQAGHLPMHLPRRLAARPLARARSTALGSALVVVMAIA